MEGILYPPPRLSAVLLDPPVFASFEFTYLDSPEELLVLDRALDLPFVFFTTPPPFFLPFPPRGCQPLDSCRLFGLDLAETEDFLAVVFRGLLAEAVAMTSLPVSAQLQICYL
jgi:hypothetical protein